MTGMANPSRNGRTSKTRSVALKIIFGAAFSAIVVFSIFWLGQGQQASALVGDIAGHGFTAEGTIVGNAESINRVDLPPGGSSSNALSISDTDGSPPPTVAVLCSVPSGNRTPPTVVWMTPATSSLEFGLVVPIPTLPCIIAPLVGATVSP